MHVSSGSRTTFRMAPFYYNFTIRVQLATLEAEKQRFREECQLDQLDSLGMSSSNEKLGIRAGSC